MRIIYTYITYICIYAHLNGFVIKWLGQLKRLIFPYDSTVFLDAKLLNEKLSYCTNYEGMAPEKKLHAVKQNVATAALRLLRHTAFQNAVEYRILIRGHVLNKNAHSCCRVPRMNQSPVREK